MIHWFRRCRPEPAPIKYTYADIMTAYAWNKSLAEWDTLPALVRVDLRENITNAPNFRVTR
jgi:hypothetical protein